MNKEKNKPLHEKLDDQQTFNRNIVKRIQELEDRRPSKLNDQVDIKLMKQEEFNTNIVKRLEELEDFKSQALIRLDQGIENRTKAFDKIDQIEEDLDIIDIKLERIDDILVVHSNQSDNQRKNHFQLQKVFSEKVMELLEGTHGKQK